MTQVTERDLETNIRRELPLMNLEDARELARILQRLIDALQPERIHVFGSQARGDVTPDSDVDLLLVVPSSDEPPYRRAQAAYHAMARRNLSVDVLVMTREEFDRRAPALASLPATVLREGRLVFCGRVPLPWRAIGAIDGRRGGGRPPGRGSSPVRPISPVPGVGDVTARAGSTHNSASLSSWAHLCSPSIR